MRILMVTPWYPDERNPNSGLFIRSQGVALSRDHEVTVISAKVDYKSFSIMSSTLTLVVSGLLREYRLTIKRSIPIYNQLNHLFITIQTAYRIAKEFKPDVIHCSIGFPGAIVGRILSFLCKVPYVFTEHTRLQNNFRSTFHKACTLFGLRKAKVIMAVSKMLADELQQATRKPVEVVPNIVEVEKFSAIKASFSSIPQLGFIGGLNSPVKGLDILLRAVSGVHRDFVLHIGGTGDLEPTYRQLAIDLNIASKCVFYGFIPPDEVPAFMSRLHFLICSSRYETFCVVLIEAMASGLPVVSTKCGGPEDFVNKTNGLLCEKEQPDALQVAIEQMMNTYQDYSPTVIRGTAGRYSAEEIYKQLMAIYRGAIAEL